MIRRGDDHFCQSLALLVVVEGEGGVALRIVGLSRYFLLGLVVIVGLNAPIFRTASR